MLYGAIQCLYLNFSLDELTVYHASVVQAKGPVLRPNWCNLVVLTYKKKYLQENYKEIKNAI